MVYLIAYGLGMLLEDSGHTEYGPFLQAAAVIVAAIHAVLLLIAAFND